MNEMKMTFKTKPALDLWIAFVQHKICVPIVLLLIHIITYGLLIPKLGFYWDDWETILITRLYPLSEFWNYFAGTRPLAAWTHILFGALLGVKPAGWHILTLILRWLTAVACWWSLTTLWPTKKWQITAAISIFSVYPLFIQQPIAVAYHQHWLAFALYFFSIGLMLKAHRRGRKGLPLHLLGMLTAFSHLSILEYFAGLELLRPLLLWINSDQNEPVKKRLKGTLLNWLSYLVILTLFLAWRMIYSLTVESDTNRPELLLSFFQSPINSIINLFELVLGDVITTLVSVWNKTLLPSVIDLRSPFYIATLVVALITILLIFLFLKSYSDGIEHSDNEGNNWKSQTLLISIMGILLGFAPIWAMGRQISLGSQFTDRYGLAVMPWAALLIVVIIDWFCSTKMKRALLVGLLVGVACGYQIQNTSTFRWSWVQQQRVYWQLFWRAPAVVDHTAFLSDNDLFQYVRPVYSINLLYPTNSNSGDLSYSFYLLREISEMLPNLGDGYPLESSHRNFKFNGNTIDSVTIFFEPSAGNCLWLLSEKDINDPFLSDTEKQAAAFSNLSRILPGPLNNQYPPRDIFGSEPSHGWCYYYQKADLARQFEEWEVVVDYGEVALAEGYYPNRPGSNAPHEWQPFIEAYGMTGQWDRAFELTHASLKRDKRYNQSFCELWKDIIEKNPQEDQILPGLDEMLTSMNCVTE